MEAKIEKDVLLGILRENRDKHRQVFEAALDGYRTRALAALKEQVRALSQGRTPEIRLIVSRPQDHTRDYDRIIRMLELDVRDQFILSEAEVAQYVQDDWRWKREFVSLSNQYAAGATQQAYGTAFLEEDDI